MSDEFGRFTDSASSPARKPYAVVPSDTVPLDPIPKALFVGTGGNITLRGVDGAADVVMKNVASGQTLDVRALFVRATGTTAADIVALA